jgi:membrane protease YdiL (CAAX protease family)
MKVNFSQKHPIMAAVLWVLVIMVFYFASGAAIAVTEASATNAMLIRAVGVFAACLLAVVYMWRSKYGFSEFGFNRLMAKDTRKVLWFLPILTIEVVPFIAGFRNDTDLFYILAVLACTLCVGFAEEVYFRGFIFQTLKVKGTSFAIIVSSLLFGITHLLNIAGGAGIGETLLQIGFAFFFGLVCVEIRVLTGSIWPVILWHALHDFLAYTTNEGTRTFMLAGAAFQTVILLAFGLYLFAVIRKKGNPS